MSDDKKPPEPQETKDPEHNPTEKPDEYQFTDWASL